MAITTTQSRTFLAQIREQQETKPLSILGLTEPLLPQPDADPLNPATLTADLQHYRDLFSKLRFSYLEQVTKEKYLRSIINQPLPTASDNAVLEESLVGMKANLQTKKRAVEALVSQIESLAREVADKYDDVTLQTRTLELLPSEIEQLEAEVARLQSEKVGEEEVSSDPRMGLGLEETERLVEQQRRHNEDMAREIEVLEREVAAKQAELDRNERDLGDLRQQRNEVTRMAREAQRVKESGGRDVLEEQGRWYQSSQKIMNGLLGQE